MYKSALFFLATVVVATVARNEATTPVPILRQINSHNDDGSYTYGYEAADGSYKIETKASTGEVRGKYGYYDDAGSLREIEYGANRNGFNPSGTGIQVPPPVAVANNIVSTNPADYDDGQYRPGPDEAGLSYTAQEQVIQRAPVSRFSNSRNLNAAPVQNYQQHQQQYQQQQQQYQQQQQQYQQQQQQYQQQQAQYQPQEQPQRPYRPVQLPSNVFNGHPARNIDINSGSYSIQY
ncbi:unnamed protein product [Allacma fusca]|uniref:Uncharacterized protein n=1 Tax=Allacma fusca TaxID=39272 RepID=A0A8J2PUT7_9HEXA|nr:unnamed protein product [Allacma fusca]